MSRVHQSSNVALLPQLALWDTPDTQLSILRDVEYEIRPVSIFTSSTPLRFEVRSPENEFMLFNESHLWLKMKITLSNPKKATIEGSDWANVTPVQNLLHSVFKHVSLQINNREVTVNPSNYSYKAFFENYLAFAESAKSGRLSAIGWNNSEEKRRKLITDCVVDSPNTAVVDFEGMLNLDLSFTEKAIPGNSTIVLELIPNPVEFYLKTKGTFSVSVDFIDVVWYVHKCLVAPPTLEGIRHGFSKAPARYVFTRTEVRNTTIPANVLDYSLENIVMGVLPRRVILGLISSKAFSGATDDPFAFSHYNLSYLNAFIDGTPYPLRPYLPDFKRNNYVREFRALYRALNQTGTDTYMTLDREKFKEKPLFAFQFAPDLSNGGSFSSHVNLRNEGHLRIQLKFAEKVPESLVALIYCEYDSCIQISELGEVHIDY